MRSGKVADNTQKTTVRSTARLWLKSASEASDDFDESTSQKRLDSFLLNWLGDRTIGSITRSEIERIHDELEDDPAEANAVIDTITEMFRFAESEGLRPPSTNPCLYVNRYPVKKTTSAD